MNIKKFGEMWKRSSDSTFFVLSLAISLYGINIFWEGFHDFDNAQNIIFIRDDITIELLRNNINYTIGPYYETTIDGGRLTLEQSYVQGIRKILGSITLIVIGFFMMGYYFSKIEKNGIKR